MVHQFAVPEQLRQHSNGTRRKCLIDEGFLPIEGLKRRAAGQGVFSDVGIDDLGIQFAHSSQSLSFAAIAGIEWLTQNVLAARRVIPEIKPITDVVQRAGKRSCNGFAPGARIDTPDHQVRAPVLVAVERARVEVCRDRRPPRAPEQIDPIDKNCRLVLANVRGRKWLPDAVGFRHQVAIHERDFEPTAVAPCPQGLVEIRQPENNGAAGSAGADHQNPHGAMAQQVGRKDMGDAHTIPSLRAQTAPMYAAAESATSLEMACACRPVHTRVPRNRPDAGLIARHWRA
jgi:hypothetical protein